jgi:hypothetical protein
MFVSLYLTQFKIDNLFCNKNLHESNYNSRKGDFKFTLSKNLANFIEFEVAGAKYLGCIQSCKNKIH